ALVEEDPLALPQWYAFQVMPGDTLSGIFLRYEVGVGEAITIAKIKDAKHLKNLKPGNEMRILVNSNNSLNQLLYVLDSKNTLKIAQTNTGFKVSTSTKPIADLAMETQALSDST